MSSRTSVYRAYDGDGAILYVGITGARLRRIDQHRHGSDWWAEASRIDLEHFETREEAMQREAALINELRPPWNRLLLGDPQPPPGYLSPKEMADRSPFTAGALRKALEREEMGSVMWLEDKYPVVHVDQFFAWVTGDEIPVPTPIDEVGP